MNVTRSSVTPLIARFQVACRTAATRTSARAVALTCGSSGGVPACHPDLQHAGVRLGLASTLVDEAMPPVEGDRAVVALEHPEVRRSVADRTRHQLVGEARPVCS